MKAKKTVALLSILISAGLMIYQYFSYGSLLPNIIAIVIAFAGFGVAMDVRNQMKSDTNALLLLLGTLFSWLGYAACLVYWGVFAGISFF